jgi:hypothetical protein
MLEIEAKTIPHSEQRYDTVGDYFRLNGATHFRVSEMQNWRFEFLILLHEMVEWALCQDAGISNRTVDTFDMNFAGEGEPGDDKKCPYYEQHQAAIIAEKLVAKMLRIDWEEYDKVVEAL